MRKIFGLIISFCFIICAMFSIFDFSSVKSIGVYAVENHDSNDKLKYVSLGDSIASGHSLPSFNGNNQYGIENNTSTAIVNGCYTQLFRDNVLKSYYSDVDAVSFARSGQTSEQLLNQLQNDSKIRSEIMEADIVTVCIGANDILTLLGSNETVWNIAMYLADINDDIISDLEEGVATCSRNYPKIVETLNSLNPNAKVLFNSVYNPFKEMKETNGGGLHWISVPSYYAPSWYWDDWYSIPFAGGVFVDIGTATENLLINLNSVIKTSISNLGNDNYRFVDVKNTFDKASYNYVLCDVVSKSRSMGGINTDNIGNHIDVHPTEAGHNAIFETIEKEFVENFSALELKNLDGVVEGKNNKIQLVNKNDKLNKNDLIKIDGNNKNQLFGGWFKDNSFENLWDFEKDVTSEKTTLFAKWSSLVCLNETKLNQLVNQTNMINFSVDVQDPVKWFVDGEEQLDEFGKNFAFSPINNEAGEYIVYCKLGEKNSLSFKVVVSYYVPTALTIKSEKLDDGSYQFSLEDENAESIDQNKLTWFMSQNGETTEIGNGTNVNVLECEDCEIFVKYLSDENLESNIISLEVDKPIIEDVVENTIDKNKIENIENLREITIVVALVGLLMINFVLNIIKKQKISKMNKSLLLRLVEKRKKQF